MSPEQCAGLISWLESQAERVPFGEISLKLIIHSGSIRRIEKTITTKEQPEEGDGS